MEADKNIRMTLIERVMFGLDSEMETNPDRFNHPQYLHGLIQQEQNVLRAHTKIFAWLLLLSSVSLFYIQGIKLDFSFLGRNIQEIPASLQMLSLFLGLSIFGFVILTIDIVLLARIRTLLIHKFIGTDMACIATAHLKGGGLWADLLSPRYIGYSSNSGHNRVSNIILIIMLLVQALLIVAFLAALICTYWFGLETNKFSLDWLTIIASSGLLIGLLGGVLLIVVLFMKFTFSLPDVGSGNVNSADILFSSEKHSV
jgi:hypothetical protein